MGLVLELIDRLNLLAIDSSRMASRVLSAASCFRRDETDARVDSCVPVGTKCIQHTVERSGTNEWRGGSWLQILSLRQSCIEFLERICS